MSAISVNPPYPIFTDTDGQPLENGYIWIGTVNLDPQGNPINVYWDSALTQVAGQPIRTISGYPSRNGSPARIYTNSEYSIRVQNKNGSTVYSASASTDFMSAVDVSFQPAGTGATARTVQSKLRDTVSVKDFGAVGDGVADDTAAIQAAINSLSSEDSLYFPSGTYIVSPPASNDYVLKLPAANNLTVYGDSTSSIVKIKSSAGNYRGILGYVNGASPSGLTVRDITFDHNGQNNVLPTTAAYSAQVRATVSTYLTTTDWDRLQFLNITVLNCDAEVSIYCPRGAYFGGSVLIDGCTWYDARNANGANFDQSFINCTCEYLQIVNNHFRGASWALAPRTAIETHASDCVVTGNTIGFFQVGMNLTGVSQAGTTYRQVCSDNTIEASRDGILIWSQSLAPASATIGFEGMTVQGNIIDMKPYDYAFAPSPIGYKGIAFFGGAQITLKRCAILDNIISYPVDLAGNSYVDLSSSKSWGAIHSYQDSAPTALLDDVVIAGNVVVNCASAGLFSDLGVWRGAQIVGNTFDNCGTTTSASAAFNNKIPLYFTSTLSSDAVIARNTFIDTNATPTITDVIFLRDRLATPVYHYNVTDNVFEFADGATLTAVTDYVGVFSSATLVRFHGEVPTDTVRLPAITGGIGSTVTIRSDGSTATKNQSGTTAWRKEVFTSTAPATGSWRLGDLAWNTAPSAGGTPGWVCTTAGTPGTWKAMANLAP